MSQSTDALLFWGYCWTEEMDSPWSHEPEDAEDEEEDVEDEDDDDMPDARYARMMGIARPSNPYPSDSDKSADAASIREAFTSYWRVEREAWEAVGMEVSSHCSNECPMPYVAVKASLTCASRGSPIAITSLEVGVDWRARLDAFCALMGITPPAGQQPQWWLASDWS